ncbi:hypothetical protein [Bifidobacterium crudilactis]|uniref:hypothetical protein n=1 Tax=Bifidobacterium crudilactis TaxID=327277 RepID=UPI002F350EA0
METGITGIPVLGSNKNRGEIDANGMHWNFWTQYIDQRTTSGADVLSAVLSGVAIADGLATRPYYEITVVESLMRYSATIRLQYDGKLEHIVMRSCEFNAADLKVSDFHKIPIEKTLKAFEPVLFGYFVDDEGTISIFGPLSSGQRLLDKIDGAALREAGPVTDSLKWVDRICAIAEINRMPPTKKVSEIIGLPQRTASHWVKLMRERIKPTYQVGTNIDSQRQLILPSLDEADDIFLGKKSPYEAFKSE